MTAATPSYRVVGWGVDTLKVSAVGLLKPDVVALLNALQAKAIAERDLRAHKGDVLVDTQWRIDGEPLLMTPHGGGRGQWTHILKCPAATFEMGPGHMNDISCQVRLSSSFLWRHGYLLAWELVADFLRPLFTKDTWFQISELHVCADIAGQPVAMLQDAHFVTRAQVVRWHKDDALVMDIQERKPRGKGKEERPGLQLVKRYREKETLTFSPRGDLEVQVYDKPKEIRRKSPDKAWFGDIWERNGWNRADPVARIEARAKRAVLHELGIETVADAFANLDRFWQYVTQKWLRHGVPNKQQSSAWPLSSWWQVVQGVTFADPLAVPGERNTVRRFRESQMLSAIFGYVESWEAWQGSEGNVTPELLVRQALRQIEANAAGHYVQKGTTFRDAVILKRKRFGITAGDAPAALDSMAEGDYALAD
ncbi:MAG: hypothetical protein H0X24_09970 [Ktedonobacterales bacterium]|nr:hypothetical protein [Ktedonobacterales bacterium]